LEDRYQAAELYFDQEASYRAVGRHLGIKADTALVWVNGLGANCKSFMEVTHELTPQWNGWLLADGKSISIRGVEHALLLTVDTATQDIPTAQLAPMENTANWRSVFMELRDQIRYPLKGLILDGDQGLLAAAREIFPSHPIQLCLRHAQEAWPRYFKYTYKGSFRGVMPFMELADEITHVRSRRQKRRALKHWQLKRQGLILCGLSDQVKRMESVLPLYFTFLRHHGMPPTNGIIESVIRQLGRKIHDTDGYEQRENAWNSLRLLIMRYRFHSFSCSRIQGHNGSSPLQLAGAKTENIRWIEFSQRSS
jgi:transposase-like protein